MIRAFEIISQHLGIPPSPKTFFYLFTLTRPSGGGLTTGWLSFRAHVNRKIFSLYEESFHHFKPVFFKVFAAPGQIPCWETKEGDLKFNCYWNKDFEAPRITEDDLRDEEKAFANFLLECFGEKHLNLKHIIGVDIGIARSRLEEMAAVNAFDEFRRRMLKRSASSSVGVAPSTEKETRPENPRPDIVPEPVASDVPQRKKQKGKRISVQKTGRNSSSSPEHNVLAKDFPYADFVDRELLTPSALKELEGDEGDLVAKLQWAGRTMLKSAALVRYSEAMVSSGVRAHAEKRAKEKELASITKEKRELEEARQKMTSEIEALRKQIGDKDRQLEAQRKDLEDRGTEIAEIKAALDKARVDSDAEVAKLKDEIRDMEDLWEQAMEGAKDNILAQAKVICPDADFRDVGLDKRVINGRIELAPPPSDATN